MFELQGIPPWILPIALVVIMYLTMFLPQKRREKKIMEMINSLKEGNEVVTVGGVIGKIINIRDNELTIETSVEKTQIKVMRWAVKETIVKAS